jgi:O-antigen/teichoic acid export membrane protein
VLLAALCLGVAGAALGMGVWALLKNSAMSDFSLGMAVALMCALPFALAWWIVPAIPLARERFETYALLTVSGPVAVLVLCPALALAAGETGAVIGFASGWAVGGLVNAIWAVRYARLPEARGGPEHGVREAGGFGARAWVNDLFQLINLRPDLFILSAYYGTTDTGVYAVTVSITSLVWIVSQPLATPWSSPPRIPGSVPRSRRTGRVR